MGSHRNTLVAVVRQELAEARGTARAVLAAAESARSEALRRKQLIRDAYSTCLAQLAEAREAARQDILRRTSTEAATLTRNVESLAALCASGSASTPWRYWTPTEPDRVGRPRLLRIGTVSYDAGDGDRRLPALVPLLDHAHVNLVGDPETADGVISGLLLRALGTTRPGDVRLTVYDPEQLGGTLAAFAPLGNAGLLSFVGPGGLSAVLDDLVEQICRVNETVLAGEYASLAELTAATAGPRREPWRVVVLLADAELTGSQRAQLDRIVRTGVACGVHLVVRGLELAPHPTVEHIAVRDGTATCDTTGELTVTLDAPPPPDRIAGFARSTAERLREGPPLDQLRRPRARQALDRVVRARPGRADRRQHRRPADLRAARRRPAARAHRRPVRLRQDEPDLRLDRLARGPVQPGGAGVLPAGLQGGRVVRAVRARPARPQLAAAGPAGRASTSTATASSVSRCCATSARSYAPGRRPPSGTRRRSWPSCAPRTRAGTGPGSSPSSTSSRCFSPGATRSPTRP
nr:hypothetical protein GCM10020092_015730 [Actinoplanes digitatis]